MRRATIALLVALGACAGETAVGPYVKNVGRQGDFLIVQKCMIVLAGDELREGACSMESMPLGSIPVQQPMPAPPGPPGGISQAPPSAAR